MEDEEFMREAFASVFSQVLIGGQPIAANRVEKSWPAFARVANDRRAAGKAIKTTLLFDDWIWPAWEEWDGKKRGDPCERMAVRITTIAYHASRRAQFAELDRPFVKFNYLSASPGRPAPPCRALDGQRVPLADCAKAFPALPCTLLDCCCEIAPVR